MDLNDLDNIFDEKEDSEVSFWNPTNKGDMKIGRVKKLGTSESFGTPYLIVNDLEGEETTIYVKSGAMSFFFNKDLVSSLKDGDWTDIAPEVLKGQLIAFRYEGQKKNPNTSRFFQSYKVLFHDELKKWHKFDSKKTETPKTEVESEISAEQIEKLIESKIKDSDNTISEKAAKTLVAKDLGLKFAEVTKILKKKD